MRNNNAALIFHERIARELEQLRVRGESLLAWLAVHPASGLYPRQVPLADMDSKWLEPRIGLLATRYCTARAAPCPGCAR